MKMGLLKGIMALTAAFAMSAVISFIVAPSTPRGTVNSFISWGNRYLNELDYEKAILQYELALEIEPFNVKALQGIIEAAQDTGDTETVKKYITQYWEGVAGDDAVYEEELDTLQRMTLGMQMHYGDPLDYADFLTVLMERTDKEGLYQLAANVAAELANKGYYEAALELEKGIFRGTSDTVCANAIVKLCEILAERAWKNYDYEGALLYLQQATEYTEDDAKLHNEILNIAEDYIIFCKNNQQYDKAREELAWVQRLCGSGCLAEYGEQIDRMQHVDDTLQEMVEQLNVAFEEENIDRIETLLNSSEFNECINEVHRVLYSNSLRKGIAPEGQGTAIYVANGQAYVYYGEYTGGKRQGHGLWYYSTGEGYLTKYTLEWENDVPNGVGTVNRYGTLYSRNQLGVIVAKYTTKDEEDFTCANGIMTGQWHVYSEVISNAPYTFELSLTLYNGYAAPLKKGEYPSDIDLFIGDRRITAYAVVNRGQSHDDYVWRTYSPWVWTVGGFGNCITVPTKGDREIAFN